MRRASSGLSVYSQAVARLGYRSLIPILLFGSCRQFPETKPANDLERQGREIFRDDTFGDERYWTDTAKLNEVDPRAWLADTLARIADQPASRPHELLPWHWPRLIEDRSLAA